MLLFLLACNTGPLGDDADDDSGFRASSCYDLLACGVAIDSPSWEGWQASYGPSSGCWEDPDLGALCALQCDAELEALRPNHEEDHPECQADDYVPFDWAFDEGDWTYDLTEILKNSTGESFSLDEWRDVMIRYSLGAVWEFERGHAPEFQVSYWYDCLQDGDDFDCSGSMMGTTVAMDGHFDSPTSVTGTQTATYEEGGQLVLAYDAWWSADFD